MSDLLIALGVGVGIAVAATLWARWLMRAFDEALGDHPVQTGPHAHPRMVQPVVDHGSRCRIGLPMPDEPTR